MIWKPSRKRPLSWSAISSFEYSPEQWYKKYVLGEEEAPSPQMQFGKEAGEQIAKNPKYIPYLRRGKRFEYEIKATFNKIPLIGFIDSYTPHTDLEEYKTGERKWDQKRADQHGQIDMYLLLLYLKHKVHPSKVKCRIHWLATHEAGNFRVYYTNTYTPVITVFETKRTMKDLLKFGARINRTVKEMQAYAKNHS